MRILLLVATMVGVAGVEPGLAQTCSGTLRMGGAFAEPTYSIRPEVSATLNVTWEIQVMDVERPGGYYSVTWDYDIVWSFLDESGTRVTERDSGNFERVRLRGPGSHRHRTADTDSSPARFPDRRNPDYRIEDVFFDDVSCR